MVAMVRTLHSGYLKLFEGLLGNKNTILRGIMCYFELRYSKVTKYISVSVGA